MHMRLCSTNGDIPVYSDSALVRHDVKNKFIFLSDFVVCSINCNEHCINDIFCLHVCNEKLYNAPISFSYVCLLESG
jgi:hypothetical protein